MIKKVLSVCIYACLTMQSVFSEFSISTIYEETGTQGGIIVDLPCGTGGAIVDYHANDRYLIQGLESNREKLLQARQRIQEEGLYGDITVSYYDGKTLPYTDNLVNLIVLRRDQADLPYSELFRALAPLGKVVILNSNPQSLATSLENVGFTVEVDEADEQLICTKPWPDTIDEWTHWLHGPDNNAVSKDQISGMPHSLQWVQDPLWLRHHNINPGLSALISAKGRVFYIMDETTFGTEIENLSEGNAHMADKWFLIARDAFNGMLLWKKPIEDWGAEAWCSPKFKSGRFSGPNQTMRRLVADGDRVFTTLGVHAPVVQLNAATGKKVRSYPQSENTFEILFHEETLFVAMNHNLHLKDEFAPGDITIAAYDVETGTRLWESTKRFSGVAPKGKYVDASMLASETGVYLVDRENIIGLNRDTGEQIWAYPRPAKAKEDLTYPIIRYIPDLCTLVYRSNTVFFSQAYDTFANTQTRNKKDAVLYAINATTGQARWTTNCATFAHGTPPDVFIKNDLVWPLLEETKTFVGLDLHTGKGVATNHPKTNIMGWDKGHHNCYRNKATANFMITAKEKGTDLTRFSDGSVESYHWIKGACRYGFMPANGMFYFPSHSCRCYMTAKLNGFIALAEKQYPTNMKPSRSVAVTRTTNSVVLNHSADTGAWPIYRGNTERHGHSAVPIATRMKQKWAVALSGKLTPPVIGGGNVFVASKDEHKIFCLDHADGTLIWTKSLSGRIDSPPTYYKGLLIFGTRNGYINCIDAETGEQYWNFRAAPEVSYISSFGQIESAWPAMGSVLVQKDKVYCAAGRSSHLNTGIYLYELDVTTGRPLQSYRLQPDVASFGEMTDGLIVDLLAGDSKKIHMSGMLFKTADLSSHTGGVWKDKQKDRLQIPYIKTYGGFLDSTLYPSSYWILNKRPNVGHLLVVDDTHAFGAQIYKKHLDNGSYNDDVLNLKAPKYKLFKNSINASESFWNTQIPIRPIALASVADHLYVAGPEASIGKWDSANDSDPWKYVEGRMGSVLAIYSKDSGMQQGELLHFDNVPVFDGMSSAYGNLYISMKDGELICFSDSIAPAPEYTEWIEQSYPPQNGPYDDQTAGFFDDPDGDGIINGVEFALMGDPSIKNSGTHTTSGMKNLNGDDYFCITIPVRTGVTFVSENNNATGSSSGVKYHIYGSTDLIQGFSMIPVEEIVPALSNGLPATKPGYEYHSFRLNDAQAQKAFFRIGIEHVE